MHRLRWITISTDSYSVWVSYFIIKNKLYVLLSSFRSMMTVKQNDPSMNTSIRLWIKSYQNHVINCSIYAATVTACLHPTTTSTAMPGKVVDIYHPMYILQQVFACAAALLLLAEIKYIYKRWTLPPGDSGLPILGDLPRMIQYGPQDMFLDRVKEYGSPCTHNMLGTPTLMISSDDDVKTWLTYERKGKAAPGFLNHMRDLLGRDTIMCVAGKEHRRLRRIFEPSFSPTAVKSYMKVMDHIAQSNLEEWSSSGKFQSSKEWSILAMKLFFECAFGHVESEVLTTLNKLFITWINGGVTIVPYPVPGNALYHAYKAKRELDKVLHGLVDKFKEGNPPDSNGAKNTMMGRLCYGVDDDGNPLADSQLINNIAFIMFAGHDTTKGSFCAFVHYLNKYPDIRRMLVEEVQGFAEPLDADQLKNDAPLLNAFLAEVWRLAAPLGDHVLRTVEEVDFKGYKVRKGVQVALSLQGYNVLKGGRYVDPEEFHIERWLPKDHPLYDPKYYQEGVSFNVMSTSYRAFNFGAHSCLGGHFAKMEARVVLTRLLQSYNIEVQNERLRKFVLLQYDNEFKLTKN